jgi:hypothetical protein
LITLRFCLSVELFERAIFAIHFVSEAEEILQFVTAGETLGVVVVVAQELMCEDGAGLQNALSARAPEMRWIALPANRGVAWLAERLAHPDDDNVAGDTAEPRLNILVIEPDDARRSAMMARIAGRGDRVTACRRVGDAMTVLSGLASAAQAPHAIVSDVHLGDGDGLSFYLGPVAAFPTSDGSSRHRRSICRPSLEGCRLCRLSFFSVVDFSVAI